jgi:Protein of unknown function (DUF3617)
MKIGITAVAVTALATVSATAQADTDPKLAMDVALGLWQVTTKGDMSGAPPIPDALLARMTPEQQAKMQQMLTGEKKYKQCMTAEKLNKGFGKDKEGTDDKKCTMTVATNTSSEYQADRQCTLGDGSHYDAKVHFNLAGKHQASGTVDVNLTQASGKTTTVHQNIDAQWLSSDCGTIKDIELEK